MTREPATTFVILPMSAKAFEIKKGQCLRIVDVDGGQPGDFVAFNLRNFHERFGQARTRVENGVYAVKAGNSLWTMNNPPQIMFRLTEKTVGRHDLLYTPCCRYALKKRFGVDRDGCFENLAKALAAWAIAPDIIPDPLNLFFNVNVGEACRIGIDEHLSSAGDTIEMEAAMDCLVAVSTCSAPVVGKANTSFRVEIRGR